MIGSSAEVGSTANNYQILARLAVGGMAEIFLARGVSATGVERYCVLKRILRERAHDAQFVRMFLEEARLAAQLQHPNVAQVYDIGKLGDSYFFTMEYVHGETVRALMQRARSLGRELPPAIVLTVIAGAAAGLHHAHERIGPDRRPLGIVHRDVSPSNLMVSFEGGVKVVDFGVAKATDRATETRSGTVKGKITYLSPEQCRGASVDRRSDLFSLGIVMWELLTTERLFRRPSDFENMTAIVNEPVPPPSQLRPNVPRELDAICLRLLAKNPADRFQTAEDIIVALEEVAPYIGAMPSSAQLGRFMRELFGQRPEPWLDLELVDAPPEGVTVTSEPLPADLSVHADAGMDAKLRRVPTLPNPIVPSNPYVAPAPIAPYPPPPPGFVEPTGSQSVSAIGSYSQAARPNAPKSRAWIYIALVAFAMFVALVVVVVLKKQQDRENAAAVPVAAIAIDAGGVEPVATDAAVEPVAIDAAVIEPTIPVDAGTVDAPQPDTPDTPDKPDKPAVTPLAKLETAIDRGRYQEAIAICIDKLPDATSCAVAACKGKNANRARSWYAKAPKSKQPSIQQTCRDAGIDVPAKKSTPTTKPDCEKNPMACQQ